MYFSCMSNFFIKIYILCIVFIWNSQNISATDIPVSDNSAMLHCIQWNRHMLKNTLQYKNFYHGYDDKNIELESSNPIATNTTGIDNIFHTASSFTCQFYRIPWAVMDDIRVGQMIPIYHPQKQRPVAFQVIYTGQNYQSYATGAGLFWGATIFSNWPTIRKLSWFVAGAMVNGFGWDKQWWWSAEAYRISQQEPYVSAPMIQMYSYFWRPLLVARNTSGMVTDVFLEDFKHWKDSKEIAKKYLRTKWYHP